MHAVACRTWSPTRALECILAHADIPFTSPQRRAFEQLLRKLARLPGQPAVVVLHHYAW